MHGASNQADRGVDVTHGEDSTLCRYGGAK